MKSIATKHVAMNPGRCVACWECVERCPKRVIGKAGFLWHHHAIFTDADACIGCNKCIKTCPHDVFFPYDEAALSAIVSKRAKFKSLFTTVRLLPLAFVTSAITGIGLHIAGHGTDHGAWHTWAVAHVVSSLIWLILGIQHIKRHGAWYKTAISKGSKKRNLVPLMLSIAFVVMATTGIVMLVCVEGANSAIGMWHYGFGILLIILSIVHLIQRSKK